MSCEVYPQLVYHTRDSDTCHMAIPSSIATPRSDMEPLRVDHQRRQASGAARAGQGERVRLSTSDTERSGASIKDLAPDIPPQHHASLLESRKRFLH